MIDYAQILSVNYVGKQWSLNGDSYDGLQWHDTSQKPTQEELDALWEATQAQVAADQQAFKAAKQSALSKLTALGLTSEEIAALTGK
jgi:hypothetical protein